MTRCYKTSKLLIAADEVAPVGRTGIGRGSGAARGHTTKSINFPAWCPHVPSEGEYALQTQRVLKAEAGHKCSEQSPPR